MNSVVILLLVYHLHGGLVETSVVQAPDYADCVSVKPLVEKFDLKEPYRVGRKVFTVDSIDGYCLVVYNQSD